MILLAVAAACARDLTLPEPPVAVESAPAFLGEESGFYALGIRSTALPPGILPPGEPFDIAVGTGLFVVQLTNPEGGIDPVAGAMLKRVDARRDVRPPDIDGCVIVDRSQDAELFFGTFDPARTGNELSGRLENGANFRGHLVAGGGALVADVDTCGGPAMQLRATRFCSFEPALSGVYAGHSTANDTDTPTWLALGFRGNLVAGLEWPRGGMSAFPSTSRFFLGNYDRFAERGALFAINEQDGNAVRAGCGQLSLAEGGGRVDLELGLGTLGEDRSCNPRGDGPVCTAGECVQASRLSGDEASECTTSVQGLVVHWEIRQCGLKRFLDVRTYDAASGELQMPFAGVELFVGALADGVPLRVADEVPDSLTARFPIDVPAEGASSRYLVYSIRKTPQGAIAAVPPCIVDRRGR